MKKLKFLGAVVIILSAATVLYLVKPMGAQETDVETITVTITPNPHGQPSVDPDSVDLYKDKDQQVEWTCSTGCDFTVNFPTSHAKPFGDATFNKAHPNSGVPTGPPGTYPYTVSVANGSHDPQIIIH
jgi:hypothetical protein